jgi:hypothetical protein
VLREGIYHIAQSAGDGVFEPTGFPGLAIDTARLFTLPE